MKQSICVFNTSNMLGNFRLFRQSYLIIALIMFHKTGKLPSKYFPLIAVCIPLFDDMALFLRDTR